MKLQESITGFYYVGTKRANITKLVSMYKHGYASGSLQEAMADLTRNDRILPEVIFCDSCFGFPAIKQWTDLLSRDERLSHIPFIIDTDRITAIDNRRFMAGKKIDDILNLSEWNENILIWKIRFLQKYKSQSRQKIKPQIEKTAGPNPGSKYVFFKRSLNKLGSWSAGISGHWRSINE
jgi:hypothetical protein